MRVATVLLVSLVGCGGSSDTNPGDSSRAGDDEPPRFAQLVYVRANGVDQPTAGGPTQPFATIQYAIDNASPGTAVAIAAGSYVESVVVQPGVSLLGGYAADDWTDRDELERDNPRYRTSITAALNIAITAGTGVGPDSIIEGLDIHGGHDTHDHHSYGIYLWDGGSPTIAFNTIEGGTGDTYGNGIGLFGSAAVIAGNTISGGNAQLAYGIRTGNQSTPTIVSNVITGDTAVDTSYGILCNNSSPTIVGNTISGGAAAGESYAIFLFGGTSPVIQNNILFAPGRDTGHCVYEFTVNCRPSGLVTNDLFDCATSLYRAFGGPGAITAIDDVNAIDIASGNVSVAPGFVSGVDWHLQSSSPQATREGATVTAEPHRDHDRVWRTVPWSMGAYELD